MASILKNCKGFRMIRRNNLNTMGYLETGISIWSDTESLKVTLRLVVLETPNYLLLEKL